MEADQLVSQKNKHEERIKGNSMLKTIMEAILKEKYFPICTIDP